jgi:AcrR family transcriptional regulator
VSSRISDDVILDAAMAMVIAHGYTGATTRQIATAAGVNEITLFRRFANKRSLVLAAIHRDLGQITNPALKASGDLETDLLGVLEHFTRTYRDHAGLPLVIILEATRNPELADLIREPVTAQLGLRELIASYQRSGHLRPEPPEQAVNALIGPLLAYAVDTQLNIASPTGPPDPRDLLDRFLQGHQSLHQSPKSNHDTETTATA